MSRLFLLEVIVFKIHLEHYGETVSSKDDISINLRFSDILNVNIAPEYFPVQGEQPIIPAVNLTIDLNMGKTYLFTHDPSELIRELKALPLELQFRINRKIAGTALIPWKSEFPDMVKIYETIGVVKSVEYEGSTDILEENIGKIGSVDVFVRMSCFGTSIETDFRMNPATDEFVFMNPRTMATFKCVSFDPRADTMTPVSSIYQPVLSVPVHSSTGPGTVSWTELFGGGTGIDAKLSVAPMAVDDEEFFAKLGANNDKDNDMQTSRSGFDIVSMVFRPPENKFFDFLNLVSAEVATKEEETLVTLTLDRQSTVDRQSTKKSEQPIVKESNSNGRKTTFVAAVDDKKEVDDPLEMTAEKLARKLCKNKDCPAARKFKEFGIGPLATGAGLGTLYGNLEPPVSYGLSHTYGTLANYGPYGLFTRPKDPNQPFIPRKNPPESQPQTRPNGNKKPCCNEKLKLRGGCLDTHEFSAVNSRLKCPIRLRLRGGGPKEHDSYSIEYLCVERKPVFDQFGQILATDESALESCHTQHYSLEAEGTPERSTAQHEPLFDLFGQILAEEESALEYCHKPHYSLDVPGRSTAQQEPVLKNVVELLPCQIQNSSKLDLYRLNSLFLEGSAWKQFYQILAEDRNPLGSCLTHDNAYELYLQEILSMIPGCRPIVEQLEQILASNEKSVKPCQPKNYLVESNDVPVCSTASQLSIMAQCDEIPTANSMGLCLRLRGGGPVDLDLYGPRSPFLECKPVMDQFDQILAAYKKALGPCGEATCPYGQNAAEKSCKKFCEQKAVPEDTKDTQSVSCDSIPCSMESCPYKEKTKNKFPAGCGSPKCAYTKYKLGLVDDDAALELQFLPPAISGKCGHPKCEYPLKPDLPPIHWDCPDPLPKGNCKNPQCPFLPPDLKALKCPGPPRKGPCGSTNCPYALPPPCDLPSCPFRQKPCPFLEQQQKNQENASCSSSSGDEDVCENPNCPFSKKEDDESACFEDPGIKGEFTQCENPNCPFARAPKPKEKTKSKKSKKCPKGLPKKALASPCGNPKCPFAPAVPQKKGKKKKPRRSVDDNPDQTENADENCDNPECPFARTVPQNKGKKKKPRKSVDDNIDQTENADENCDNPECPFARTVPQNRGKKKKPRKSVDDSIDQTENADENCDNPECPAAQTPKKKETDSICANPTCPYAPKESSSCDEEESSEDTSTTETEGSICNDPYCPYVQPLPSCGVPNCPYEPVPVLTRPAECPPKRSSRKDSCNSKQEKEEPLQVETETTIICEEVPEQEEVTDEPKSKNGKKKKRGKFVYSTGDRYPGVKVGHKECVTPIFNVPPGMGWLWNIHTPILRLKPRRGWKPGAIVRTIANRIKAHRQMKGLGILQVPKFRKDKGGSGSEDDVNVSPKPTLHIQKKDGSYWITMNPLKDPNTLADNEDPYMECTPMQFKITKKKQANGGENDSKTCCCEDEDSSSSSDSELDIEFTPPAGIIHPERFKKKKNVIHCDTQYDPSDFEVKKEKENKEKGAGGKKEKGGKKGDKKEKGKDKGAKGGKDKKKK